MNLSTITCQNLETKKVYLLLRIEISSFFKTVGDRIDAIVIHERIKFEGWVHIKERHLILRTQPNMSLSIVKSCQYTAIHIYCNISVKDLKYTYILKTKLNKWDLFICRTTYCHFSTGNWPVHLPTILCFYIDKQVSNSRSPKRYCYLVLKSRFPVSIDQSWRMMCFEHVLHEKYSKFFHVFWILTIAKTVTEGFTTISTTDRFANYDPNYIWMIS